MIEAILALSLVAQDATLEEEYVLPAEVCRGFWLLPVSLQPGPSGEERVLWFLHDTGASNTYLDPDSIERVSGQVLAEGTTARITDASSGPLSINEMPTEVRELDHLSISLGRPIDGLMSVYALQDFLLILDYPAEEMRLRQGSLPRPDGEIVFSTRGPDRRPWLRVDLAGRTRPLLIDSGAGSLTIAVNNIDRFDLLDEPQVLASSTRINRIEQRRLARLNGEADIAGLRVQYPVMEEVPQSELLGGELLKHFVITLDQPNRRVQMVPATQSPVPAEDHFEIGAGLRPTTEGFEVLAIYPDTPASAGGLQAGDVMTHFDGVRVAERGCGPRTAQGPLQVSVLRGGESIALALEMVPVLDYPGAGDR